MRLAIIGAGFMADIIAKRAKSLDIETYCFAWEQGAVAKESVDYFFPISVLDKDQILEICERYKIDGVVAAADISINTAAYVAEKLDLLGNPIEVAQNIGDKFFVREKTKNVAGLSQINYAIVETYDQIEPLKVQYPFVLKPTNSGGKDGVILVNCRDELMSAFDFSKKGHEHLIIEEFIKGKEYSVESLSYKGTHNIVQITEKVNSGAPHFVELAHHQPSDISPNMRRKIIKVMKGVLSAVGIQNGPCHTEIKIDSDKIYLIEVNGRLGGDHISYPLTELSTGYPYIAGVIKAALGILESVEIRKEDTSFASVFFVTQQTSNLKKIFDECDKYDWCYEKYKASDELITLEENNGFRINYFIYYSKDKKPDFLRELCNCWCRDVTIQSPCKGRIKTKDQVFDR